MNTPKKGIFPSSPPIATSLLLTYCTVIEKIREKFQFGKKSAKVLQVLLIQLVSFGRASAPVHCAHPSF